MCLLLRVDLKKHGQYTYLFLIDTFKMLPIPLLFSFVYPAMLVFVMVRYQQGLNTALAAQTNLKLVLALPFILVLLIAAGFSTSAYGQSYPVERARFFAHFL